ncbi:MAG TPA: PIG-L family deacetylase [Gemmatimonadales bacterium]|nr:PIG-L family deacetylase [Gemmatimonadales bacterium]
MTHTMNLVARSLAAVALLAICPAPGYAQDGGPGTGGLVQQARDRLALSRAERVLMIGAHPDDEDNGLLTILSRGAGASVAYLSLTRGEGGQNLIGSELGASLGVLRASELVAARRIDGGAQFFTRAYDFGFSKTAEETFRFWPRDSVLKDAVRIIRRFRPHVIVSVFSGTPRDGHGHHQVAGILAREAFDAAGNAERFPELRTEEGLAPWQAQKFYRDYGVTDGITLEAGVIEPASGHTLLQLSRRSRSQHRSQDMGTLEELGPGRSRILLEARAPGVEAGPDSGIFHRVRAGQRVDDGTADRLALADHGIILDAWVGDHEVHRGQPLSLNLLAFNGGSDTVEVWTGRDVADPFIGDSTPACLRSVQLLAPGGLYRCVVPLTVAQWAAVSQPYYLIEPAEGAMYRFAGRVENRGLPFEPPPVANFRVSFGDGTSVSTTREITARWLDQGLGEVRAPLQVVPRVMVDVLPGRFIWPRGMRSRRFAVQLEHIGNDTLTAQVRLVAPDGWRVDSVRTVKFSTTGERRTIGFEVTAPERPADGEVSFLAEVVTANDTLRLGARRIDYPHIRARTVFHLAEATAVVAPVQFAERRVGYLRGAADEIPEALAAAGVPFRLLGDADIDGPLLDSLDVVVIGPRAYETSAAVRSAHPRLLRFAEAGGTLIIQYQQYQFVQGGFTPLPFAIARPHDRGTDEHGAVRWLDPSAPMARTPNRIVAGDFDDWVQERGLYFASTWDPRWTPLLEMDEPGEGSRRGGLLISEFGRGKVIYTGIAFFRQLPAAVPGAWRLFANLLAQ